MPAPQNPPAEQTEPSAKDVAAVAATLVDKLAPLPPALQLRALQAAATMLGIDRSRNNQQQQRSNNQQQRSGGNR